MQNAAESVNPITITDAALAEAVEYARLRGANADAIKGVCRRYVPTGKIYTATQATRSALVADLAGLGVPTPAFQIIERLVGIANGAGGLFVLAGIDPQGSITNEHIQNEGESRFIYRAFAAALDRLTGRNIYLPPVLMRADLEEGRRGTDQDVIAVLALVPDLDADHGCDVEAALTKLPFVPGAEVVTSPGNLQAWLFLDKPMAPQEATAFRHAIVSAIGADAAGKSLCHGGRLPGTLNYPTAVKIERGRDPKPVPVTLRSWESDFPVTLADLRKAFPDAKAEPRQSGPFDWTKRDREHKPMQEPQITAMLNNSRWLSHPDKRSAGCAALVSAARKRGYSPEEAVALISDHMPAGCLAHYHGEQDVRDDVKRLWEKHKPEKSAADTFAHVDIPAESEPVQAASLVPAGTMSFAPLDSIVIDPNIEFTDRGNNGVLKPTTANARAALRACRVDCKYDEFRGLCIIGGEVLNGWHGEVTDNIIKRLCHFMKEAFGFEPTPVTMQLAVEQNCLMRRFNPVTDYLDSLKWDGVKRIDTWLMDHMGTPDTPLNRAIGRIMLVAAVRRARKPGCKFDEIIVFESPEGWNKSSALALLAGEEYFSDQSLLKEPERTQAEHLRGKWIYEIADLTGLSKADRDHVKAMASRQVDRVRHAYARNETNQPRTCILTATTNDSDYLEGDTGHRRFWPVPVTRLISLDKLAADRDQLLAEAAHYEAQGESIRLDPSLWRSASKEQEGRRLRDPWEDILARVQGAPSPDPDGRPDWHEERVHSTDLLTRHLKIEPGRQIGAHAKRAKRTMQALGWEYAGNLRIGNEQGKGFRRVVAGPVPSGASENPELVLLQDSLDFEIRRPAASDPDGLN